MPKLRLTPQALKLVFSHAKAIHNKPVKLNKALQQPFLVKHPSKDPAQLRPTYQEYGIKRTEG